MKQVTKYVLAAAAAMTVASAVEAGVVKFKTAGGQVLGVGPTGTNYTAASIGAEAAFYTSLGNTNGVDIDSFASGELSVRRIAQGWSDLIYGVGSSNFLTFTRLYDKGVTGAAQPNIGINPSSPLTQYTDAIWADGTVDIAFRAKYAGDNQVLGTLAGTSGMSFANAVSIAGGNTVSAFNALLSTNGTPFRFGRSSGSLTTASESSDMTNPDVMISFLVTGPGIATPTYAIFFEDRPNGDRDFNDVAVLFSGISGGPLIPLPGAAVMGLVLMSGLGLTRVRRSLA